MWLANEIRLLCSMLMTTVINYVLLQIANKTEQPVLLFLHLAFFAHPPSLCTTYCDNCKTHCLIKTESLVRNKVTTG